MFKGFLGFTFSLILANVAVAEQLTEKLEKFRRRTETNLSIALRNQMGNPNLNVQLSVADVSDLKETLGSVERAYKKQQQRIQFAHLALSGVVGGGAGGLMALDRKTRIFETPGSLNEADALFAEALELDACTPYFPATRPDLMMRRNRILEMYPTVRASVEGDLETLTRETGVRLTYAASTQVASVEGLGLTRPLFTSEKARDFALQQTIRRMLKTDLEALAKEQTGGFQIIDLPVGRISSFHEGMISRVSGTYPNAQFTLRLDGNEITKSLEGVLKLFDSSWESGNSKNWFDVWVLTIQAAARENVPFLYPQRRGGGYGQFRLLYTPRNGTATTSTQVVDRILNSLSEQLPELLAEHPSIAITSVSSKVRIALLENLEIVEGTHPVQWFRFVGDILDSPRTIGIGAGLLVWVILGVSFYQFEDKVLLTNASELPLHPWNETATHFRPDYLDSLAKVAKGSETRTVNVSIPPRLFAAAYHLQSK